MDQDFQKLIDSLPPRPHRSVLGQYEELIRVMRTQGWTYRAVAKFLFETCGLRVSPSNIHHFVKAQSRKEGNREQQQRSSKQIQILPIVECGVVMKAELYERISALKNQAPQRDAPERKFEFDPDEPLRLNKVADAPHKQKD